MMDKRGFQKTNKEIKIKNIGNTKKEMFKTKKLNHKKPKTIIKL